MNTKNKVLISLSVALIILLVTYGIFGTIDFIKKYKYINGASELKEIDTYLKYKEIRVNDSLPTFRDFVSNREINGYIEIYDGENLVNENTKLKVGKYKVILNINGKNEEAVLNIIE